MDYRILDRVCSEHEMRSLKETFLANVGGSPDFEEMANGLGIDAADFDEKEVADAWFERTLSRLEGETLTIHRHMTVADVDAFADGIADGSLEAGDHWSLDPDTESPFPDQSVHDVILTATVERAQIEWFSTMQAFFVHPWESELVFSGAPKVVKIFDVRTGVARDLPEPQASIFSAT